MMVSGVGKLEMKGAEPVTVRSGAYAMLPAHHAHQLTCTTSCTMFLYSDGIFDMHYIDASGAEIPAAEALKKK
jgi:quercetin dioxygenase-like cupin family protein